MNKRSLLAVPAALAVSGLPALPAPTPHSTSYPCPLTGREIPLDGWSYAQHAVLAMAAQLQEMGVRVTPRMGMPEWPTWSDVPLAPVTLRHEHGGPVVNSEGNEWRYGVTLPTVEDIRSHDDYPHTGSAEDYMALICGESMAIHALEDLSECPELRYLVGAA